MFAHRTPKLALALVLAALMLLTAACSGGTKAPAEEKKPDAAPAAPAPVTLKFTVWTAADAHLKLFNDIAAEYKKLHPEVTVNFQSISFDDYVAKVTMQLAGGDPPDAGWVLESSAPTFIQAGALMDLGAALTNNAAYDYADLSQPAMQLWVRGDKVYGVPFSTSPFFIIYNRDMFEKAGVETPDKLLARGAWTWEAFAEAAKQIKAKSPAGQFGYESIDGQGFTARTWHTLVPIIRAYGGDAWTADGTKCTVDSPEAVAAVKLYQKMVVADKSTPAPGEQADFFSGKAAMTMAQISRFSKLANAPFKWDIAPLPAGPKGAAPVVGQAAVGVFNASKHKAAAADFVAFWTNKENTAKLAAFFPPARKSVLDAGTMAKLNTQVPAASLVKAVDDGIKNGRVLPTHVEFPKIDLASRAAFEALWKPNADVQAALTGVCKAIQPLMGK
ncbi:MAG TPA: sugar ABC transporter substrate-binding protein [Symbiobacteriaceae bacterium]|nr:sugar ABC transporter substrate-binding protein [Symbiobacteriaceae bacterium]